MRHLHSGTFRFTFYIALLFALPFKNMFGFSKVQFQCYCAEQSGVLFPFHLSVETTAVLVLALQAALFCSAIGLLTKVAQWSSFFLLAILNMNQLKFCFNNFGIMGIVIPLLFWAVLDRFSTHRVDTYLLRRFQRSADRAVVPAATQYRLLLFSIMGYFCIIFFLAGVAKLRIAGPQWMSATSIRNILLTQNYLFRGTWAYQQFGHLQPYILPSDVILWAIGVGTVAIELAAPLILFLGKHGKHILIHLFFLQVGIYMLMYIEFFSWIVFYMTYVFYYVEFGLAWKTRSEVFRDLRYLFRNEEA